MLNTDFFKKSALLWVGNLFYSLLGITIFYLLANKLGPENYGDYSLVLSMVAMISLAFYGIIGESIVRFSYENKKEVLHYGLRLELIFGVISFLLLFLFADRIAHIYQKPIADVVRIVSFSFLLTPFIEVVKSQGIGLKKVNQFVFLSIIFQLGMILSLFLVFRIGKTAFLAAFAFLAANIITFLVSLKDIKLSFLFLRKRSRILLRMSKYIKDGFLYGLTKNLYFQSPFIVGGYFVGSVDLAFYSFGLSLGTQGLFTFITAVQTMLLPYIVSIKNKLKISEYISVVIKAGIVVTVVLSVMILILVYLLLPIFFPEYLDAFKYIPWIFLAFVFLNLRAPMALFKVAERTDILTRISIFTALVSIILCLFMSFLFGLIGIIITLNLSVLISSYLHIYYLKKINNIKISLLITMRDWRIFSRYFNLFIKSFKKKFLFTARRNL